MRNKREAGILNRPTLVVLAAGLGTRYGGKAGLKQVDPVGPNGEIIMDYSIYDAAQAGFAKVVFVIKREMEENFRENIGRRVSGVMETAYAFQELDDLPAGYTVPAGRVKPWGTAHAVLAARHAVDTPFAVIGADDFFGRGTFQVMGEYLSRVDPDSEDFAMAGFAIENTVTANGHVARGVCETENGYLRSVTERTHITLTPDGKPQYSLDDGVTNIPIPLGSVASMNVWAFTPRIFGELEQGLSAAIDGMADPVKGEYYLPSAVDALIRAGRATVKVLHTDERWYGVTWQQDKPAVVEAIAGMVRRGVYPEKLW